jgi:putative DNA primase/helicase
MLNQFLTQQRVGIRPLGESRLVQVPCTQFVMADGNNLESVADMTRREVKRYMNAKRECPELRSFKEAPFALIEADRGKYIAAILTILRAYAVAGYPDQPKVLNGYDEWSRRVRGAVMHLGEADPVRSMESNRTDDPKRAVRPAIMEFWKTFIKNDEVTAADIVNIAKGDQYFREAVMSVAANERAEPDVVKFGYWLRNNRSKYCGSMSIESAGTKHGGAAVWQLCGVDWKAAAEAKAAADAAAGVPAADVIQFRPNTAAQARAHRAQEDFDSVAKPEPTEAEKAAAAAAELERMMG